MRLTKRVPAYRAAFFVRGALAALCLGVFLYAYSGRGFAGSGLAGLAKFAIGRQISARATGFGLTSVSVAAFLAAALIAGRLFCSFLCPLGALQEFLWRASSRLGVARRKYISPWRIRYLSPLMAAVGIILSIPLLFIAADPLSNFGRGVASLAGLAAGAMYPIGYLHIAALAAVAALALARGRRFCDWCPAGVALGLASRAAPFGMRLDETRCVSCGACERSCPMNCADAAGKKIDASRCVLCAGCAAACPGGHIRFGYRRSYRNIPGRRNFVKYAGSLIISACYFGGGNLREFVGITAREAEGGLILPPGARSESHFLSRCVGCQACVKVCPVSVIKQAGARPRIVYGEAYCQYSCTECGALCPTGAIERLSVEEKRRTRVALSELDLSGCVVMTKRQACGACAEVCPTRALHMESYGGEGSGLFIPVFDEEYCIGCGACLCVCPAEPNAFAINPVPSQTMTPGLRVAPEGAGGAGSVRPMTKDDDFPF